MAGDQLYALEKFEMAVRSLAVGPGDVRSRLESAYIIIHTVKSDDLPEEVREDFAWIMHQLTKREPRHKDEGKLQSTLAQIQNRTGVRIAQNIVSIWEKLRNCKEET